MRSATADDIVDHTVSHTPDSTDSPWTTDMKSFADSSTRSATEKTLKAVGILLWSVVYVYVIVVAHATSRVCLIRRDLLAYNIVWEALRTFVWRPDDSLAMRALFGVGWFGLDLPIVWGFWAYGDGDPRVSLDRQRVEFVAWLATYAVVGLAVDKRSKSASRVWRHLSFILGTLGCASIVRHEVAYRTYNPYFELMAWSAFVGNLVYMRSCWCSYKGWTSPRRHPLKFLFVVGVYAPTFVYNVYFVHLAVARRGGGPA